MFKYATLVFTSIGPQLVFNSITGTCSPSLCLPHWICFYCQFITHLKNHLFPLKKSLFPTFDSKKKISGAYLVTGSKSLWFNSKRIVQRLWDPLILRREHLFGEVKNTNEIVFMSAGPNPSTICTAIQTEQKEISTRSTRTPYPLHRRQLLYQLIQRRSPPDQIEPRNFCTEYNRSINWSKGDTHQIKSNTVTSAPKKTALPTDSNEISTRSNRTP